MQQAYRALRVVAEAQTIRIVLTPNPGELMFRELCTACATLNTESSIGLKAVVLDFTLGHDAESVEDKHSIDEACTALQAVPQPVLAVVRSTLSAAAYALVRAADLTLVADDAVLSIPGTHPDDDTLTGVQAARLGYVTWSAPVNVINNEMERILALLRGKSAIALRLTKASVRLGNVDAQSTAPRGDAAITDAMKRSRLEALKQVNTLYLTQVMKTADAHEGLRAFLEKRKPQWKNQ